MKSHRCGRWKDDNALFGKTNRVTLTALSCTTKHAWEKGNKIDGKFYWDACCLVKLIQCLTKIINYEWGCDNFQQSSLPRLVLPVGNFGS